jgi:hypothetical protein
MNTIEMNAIQRTARIATGKEKDPRWKGPLVNLERYITRRAIGIPGIIIQTEFNPVIR